MKEARHTAEALGLKYLGTAGVLLSAFRKGLLEEFETTVEDLTSVSWLAPEVVTTIMKLAREEQFK